MKAVKNNVNVGFIMESFAVIGMGSIAKRHIANLRLLYPIAKILIVSSSGKNLELPSGADVVIDVNELIVSRPKYVIIASPAPYHVGMAKLLIQHGISVLIEKPLSASYESAIDFEAYCRQFGVSRVAVGYCLRFLPSARIVKAFLDGGQLGTLYNVVCNVGQYLPGWRKDKDYKESVSAKKELGGGALLELSHELDYLQWMLGDLTLQHSWLRVTDELGLEVEEIADLIFTSTLGAYVNVHLDFIQKSTQRKCEFIGQNGRLVWNLIENSIKFYGAREMEVLYMEAEYDKNKMYLDMLLAFEHVEQHGFDELATIPSSVKVIKLIDEAKQINKWRDVF